MTSTSRHSCAYLPHYWVNTKIKSEKIKVVEGKVNAHCKREAAVCTGVLIKVKVKAICGSYSTDALRHIVFLPE